MEKAAPSLANPEYQHALRAPQKGPACQYKWEIPASYMDISQWRMTSNAHEHLEFRAHRILSLPFTWPDPRPCESVREEQPWKDLNLAAVQIPVWEKRRRFWARPQLSLNQTFALRDKERKKRCLRRRGVATHVACVSQTSCSIHNSTFKRCLMLSGRVPTSQTHVAQLIWLLPAEMTGTTACSAPWVDMTHAGLPDMWSSWTDTNHGSPC